MTMRVLTACIFVLPALISACTYSHGSPRATFDYYFNLCSDAPKPDPLCDAWDDLGGVVAYQIENTTQKKSCTALGIKKDPTFEILDSLETKNNALMGVKITFENGAACRKEADEKRKFSVNVRCVKEKTTLKRISTVSEDLEQGCVYEVDIFDIAGCPTECHSSSHTQLCAGHGVCGMDSGSNRARCFCNDGWGSADCNEEVSESTGPSSSSVNSVLIVFVIILLGLLLGLSYVLYGRIKALNADSNPYGAFEDQVPNSAAHM